MNRVFAMMWILTLGTGTVVWPSPDAAVVGTVSYQGKAPVTQPVEIARDQEACGRQSVPFETLLVGEGGGLQNVVITIVGTAGTASMGEVTLGQEGCAFAPHVQVAGAGSGLTLLNNDELLHNVHAHQGEKTLFNVAMPFKGQKLKRTLSQPGVVAVTCDVHKWMGAFIVVTDSPFFAVSGAGGTFRLEGVPAGTYELEAWHESLGKITQSVTVPASGEAEVSVTFTAK